MIRTRSKTHQKFPRHETLLNIWATDCTPSTAKDISMSHSMSLIKDLLNPNFKRLILRNWWMCDRVNLLKNAIRYRLKHIFRESSKENSYARSSFGRQILDRWDWMVKEKSKDYPNIKTVSLFKQLWKVLQNVRGKREAWEYDSLRNNDRDSSRTVIGQCSGCGGCITRRFNDYQDAKKDGTVANRFDWEQCRRLCSVSLWALWWTRFQNRCQGWLLLKRWGERRIRTFWLLNPDSLELVTDRIDLAQVAVMTTTTKSCSWT
jgi:hypothetical protein